MAAKVILLQKGHHAPREPGFLRGTGASGEQEVVGTLVDKLAGRLGADRRFKVRVIPGAVPGDIKNGSFKVDAFISFHCDGSNDRSRKGWGVGYPNGRPNKALATLIGSEFGEFHQSPRLPDNYTRNMSRYYAWSRIPTPGPEVIVEHGFSSSPQEKAWMISHAPRFAMAYHEALVAYFKLAAIEPEDPEKLAKRRTDLRAWIIASREIGWTWRKLKETPEWKEWRRLGGS